MKSIFIAVLSIFLISSSVQASPRLRDAQREVMRLRKAERVFAKKVARLTESEKKTLKRKLVGTDSDKDGVSDIIEGALGSDRCSKDSDDDGQNDDKDTQERTPNSGNNPRSPGNSREFEAKGKVVSFNEPTLQISEQRVGIFVVNTYELTAKTVFLGLGFSKRDLVEKTCVEVEGIISSAGTKLVEKIKLDDDC